VWLKRCCKFCGSLKYLIKPAYNLPFLSTKFHKGKVFYWDCVMGEFWMENEGYIGRPYGTVCGVWRLQSRG
jgi:hypothetical protein